MTINFYNLNKAFSYFIWTHYKICRVWRYGMDHLGASARCGSHQSRHNKGQRPHSTTYSPCI